MSDKIEMNDILDAIDRARDDAIGKAFAVLEASIVMGEEGAQLRFGTALASILHAHAIAGEMARKIGEKA